MAEYQCEACDREMADPYLRERYQGYDETVLLAFCRSCVEEGEKPI